jgi:hypothetical protein
MTNFQLLCVSLHAQQTKITTGDLKDGAATLRREFSSILLRHSYPSECEEGRKAGRQGGRERGETPNEQRGDYQLNF